MSAASLRELLAAMGTIDDESLAEILDALSAMDGLEALTSALEAARREMAGLKGGEAQGVEDALKRLVRDTARLRTSGSPMGPMPGIGQGGAANKADVGEIPEATERLRGGLNPEGKFSQGTPFRGLPRVEDSNADFERTIQRAASAAEESLGRDQLAPGARPYVRRYFDALRDAGTEKK